MILFFYLVREMVFPIFLALGVISSILMMDQLYKFVPFLQATGLELQPLLLVFLYSLPSILLISTPVSLMIGVYVGVHRQSADSEIISMRAAGVSLEFLLWPVVSLSAVVALVVLLEGHFLSPWGVSKLDELKYNLIKRTTKVNLAVGRINNFFGKKMIYIFGEEQNLFKGILIADWSSPHDHVMVEAAQGRIFFDEKKKKVFFHLEKGKLHSYQEKDQSRIVSFENLDYQLDPPSFDTSQLPSRYRKPKKNFDKRDMAMMSDELLDRIQKAKAKSKEYWEYTDEYHGRWVIALSCLAFGIIALPMGIFDPRNPKTGKFITMILIMIAYYSLFSQTRSLMVQGRSQPVVMYLPMLLLVGMGFYNHYKLNHDLSSLRSYLLDKLRRKKRPPAA